MTKNEAETRYELIDPVLRGKGYRVPYIRFETRAPVEPTGPKGRRRKGPGKTDYLFCVEGRQKPAAPDRTVPFPGLFRLASSAASNLQTHDLRSGSNDWQ